MNNKKNTSQRGKFQRNKSQESRHNNRNRKPDNKQASSSGRSFNGGKKRGFGSKNSRGSKKKRPSFDPSIFINKNPVEQILEVYKPKHTFFDFGFDKNITNRLSKMGLVHPSPIQDQIIPEILLGKDVVGIAETGTGKTAAFLLPLIQKTLQNKNLQTLIMTPTRELAIQIEEELQRLSYGLIGREKLSSTVCVGGAYIRPQINGLRKKNHFIIGTPGRLIDLYEKKHFDTTKVTAVVLDEADRMLDMGFINQIKTLLSNIPKERETLFFSATIDDRTNKLVGDFLRNPTIISVKKKDVTNSIRQDVVYHGPNDKFEKLSSLLNEQQYQRVIIFGSMKHSVEKLSKQLNSSGISSESIHGNKNHQQRQRALNNFKNGKVKVLTATDVAARGIHVNDVSHVINYDLPGTFEDYVHRIGRTGRGDKKGEALTFVSGNK